MSCKPDGDVCKLKTMSCSASCDCCAGNCETMDTCKQDNVGVPRCAPAACVPAGGGCASSASCCNHLPCIPNPSAGAGDAGASRFICATASCVPQCSACTNNADCCPGSSCAMQPGSAIGVCGPCNGNPPPQDGGTTSSSSGGARAAGAAAPAAARRLRRPTQARRAPSTGRCARRRPTAATTSRARAGSASSSERRRRASGEDLSVGSARAPAYWQVCRGEM